MKKIKINMWNKKKKKDQIGSENLKVQGKVKIRKQASIKID